MDWKWFWMSYKEYLCYEHWNCSQEEYNKYVLQILPWNSKPRLGGCPVAGLVAAGGKSHQVGKRDKKGKFRRQAGKENPNNLHHQYQYDILLGWLAGWCWSFEFEKESVHTGTAAWFVEIVEIVDNGTFHIFYCYGDFHEKIVGLSVCLIVGGLNQPPICIWKGGFSLQFSPHIERECYFNFAK